MDDWCWRSALEIAEAVGQRQISAIEVTRAHLERVAREEPRLHCFLRVDGEGALAQARAVEDSLASGRESLPLAGVPVALKDLFVTRGLETTAASAILAGWVPPY